MLLCYPIDSKQAYENLKLWMNEIESNCEEDVLIFLCGTKSDLETSRQVSQEMARQFQDSLQIHYFIETSAQNASNIHTLFKDMAKFMYVRFKDQMEAERLMSDVTGASQRSSSNLI